MKTEFEKRIQFLIAILSNEFKNFQLVVHKSLANKYGHTFDCFICVVLQNLTILFDFISNSLKPIYIILVRQYRKTYSIACSLLLYIIRQFNLAFVQNDISSFQKNNICMNSLLSKISDFLSSPPL